MTLWSVRMKVYFRHKQKFYFYAGAGVRPGMVFVQKYSFAILKYLSPGFDSALLYLPNYA